MRSILKLSAFEPLWLLVFINQSFQKTDRNSLHITF